MPRRGDLWHRCTRCLRENNAVTSSYKGKTFLHWCNYRAGRRVRRVTSQQLSVKREFLLIRAPRRVKILPFCTRASTRKNSKPVPWPRNWSSASVGNEVEDFILLTEQRRVSCSWKIRPQWTKQKHSLRKAYCQSQYMRKYRTRSHVTFTVDKVECYNSSLNYFVM